MDDIKQVVFIILAIGAFSGAVLNIFELTSKFIKCIYKVFKFDKANKKSENRSNKSNTSEVDEKIDTNTESVVNNIENNTSILHIGNIIINNWPAPTDLPPQEGGHDGD